MNWLVSLVVRSATATIEVLGSIPRSSKVLLSFSMKFSIAGVRICAWLMAIGSPPIPWDLNIPANCGCILVHLCLILRQYRRGAFDADRNVENKTVVRHGGRPPGLLIYTVIMA